MIKSQLSIHTIYLFIVNLIMVVSLHKRCIALKIGLVLFNKNRCFFFANGHVVVIQYKLIYMYTTWSYDDIRTVVIVF